MKFGEIKLGTVVQFQEHELRRTNCYYQEPCVGAQDQLLFKQVRNGMIFLWMGMVKPPFVSATVRVYYKLYEPVAMTSVWIVSDSLGENVLRVI